MSFLIDNKEFSASQSYSSSLKVKSALKTYSVVITDEYEGLTAFFKRFDAEHDVLLIDTIVLDLYKDRFSDIDSKRIFAVEAIEENKTLDKATEILLFMSGINFTKAGTLYVFGGGILQDLAAFVGATFKRGINWTLFPTTLLSMSDSCIGSKSSINFQGGKNQLGLFSAPDEIIIDIAFLKTLELRELHSGLGEVIKLHLIGGESFYRTYGQLVEKGEVRNFSDYKILIYNSLAIKKEVIEEDEFDKTYRRALNYGHTFGHVLESLSHYRIPHGQAIAAGMMLANSLGGTYDKEFNSSIADLIFPEYWELIKSLDKVQMFNLIKHDKKVVGDVLNIVFLEDIGVSRIIPVQLNNEFVENIYKILDK